MKVLLLIIFCSAGYLLAYHTYGKFLVHRIFKLDSHRIAPSKARQDGIDYVPAKKSLIFGHHYTSIAGTGPIVGPAIGIIWGWLPAVLWVFLGAIFMGAVHDFGTLVVSLRNEGKSISEVAARYINGRIRFIFFAVVFLTLLILVAIFGVIISAVFTRFPQSVIPVWLQIPIAIVLGHFIYRKKVNTVKATIVAVVGMYFCILLGSYFPVQIPSLGYMSPTGVWVILLLLYTWIASTLPVTTLLQPRDYINAWQLFIAMGLMILGIVGASRAGVLEMFVPAVNTDLPEHTLSLWPFMFVIIACGAISGFHSLVSSGTTSKQISSESDALFVGYGSMLLEGFLALLVIICVGAGIGIGVETVDQGFLGGKAAWLYYYGDWIGSKGLTDKIEPVVVGAANAMSIIGISKNVGMAIIGVFIASFAGTTLDTSVRLQRYVISELSMDLKTPWLTNRWSATTFAVISALVLAFATGADGTGAMLLWPLFGTANQLLAALALLVVSAYLQEKGGKKYLVSAIPCLLMLLITNWAMVVNEFRFIKEENYLLASISGVMFILALWMTIESLYTMLKKIAYFSRS
ncbi:MAG: carbon starvation CstA family protein [Chlamydiota bacterium]